MKYYIQRGLNEYGPYTLADLQRYVVSGNILLTDLTRNEAMQEWVPVSQVIGNIPLAPPASTPPAASPYGTAPSASAGTGIVYGSSPAATGASPTGATSTSANPAGATPTGANPASVNPAGAPAQGGSPTIPVYGATAGASASPTSSAPAGGTVYGSPGAPGPTPSYSGANIPAGGTVYGSAGPAYNAPGMTPAYGGQPIAGPIPIDFHWALVLVISIFTCGIFWIVWLIVQAAFVKKIRPQSNALMLAIVYIALSFVGGFVRAFALALAASAGGIGNGYGSLGALIGLLLSLASWVVYFVAVFGMKSDLENYYNSVERINLRLNGVMVFFFAVFYFQHHFSRISAWKKTGILAPQG